MARVIRRSSARKDRVWVTARFGLTFTNDNDGLVNAGLVPQTGRSGTIWNFLESEGGTLRAARPITIAGIHVFAVGTFTAFSPNSIPLIGLGVQGAMGQQVGLLENLPILGTAEAANAFPLVAGPRSVGASGDGSTRQATMIWNESSKAMRKVGSGQFIYMSGNSVHTGTSSFSVSGYARFLALL